MRGFSRPGFLHSKKFARAKLRLQKVLFPSLACIESLRIRFLHRAYVIYPSGNFAPRFLCGESFRCIAGNIVAFILTLGTLHGLWSSDVAVATSDRRLKREVEPIEDALARQM